MATEIEKKEVVRKLFALGISFKKFVGDEKKLKLLKMASQATNRNLAYCYGYWDGKKNNDKCLLCRNWNSFFFFNNEIKSQNKIKWLVVNKLINAFPLLKDGKN